MSAIEKACSLLGGQAKLADLFNVSVQAVGKWVKRGAPPADRCIAIEEATKGEVTRYDLRPDVFGDSPEEAAA